MCTCKWPQAVAIALACLGMLIPDSLACAEQPGGAVSALAAADVTLDAEGRIVGTVVDETGRPSAGRLVAAHKLQDEVSRSRSDENGRFALSAAGGGVYTVVVDDQITLLRCWTLGTAPPQATPTVLLQPSSVIRGQISPSACGLSNPWVISGIVLTAIIIPVAIHNNREDRNAGS